MSETWWAGALHRQGMPRSEIRAVLGAADPAVVRRHLDLHRERLEERVAEQKDQLSRLEEMLTGRPLASIEHSDVRAEAWSRSSRG